MNDEAAFLTAIAADPKDELGYLVFADWLQEQGEEVRAGLVRDPRTRPLLGPTLADPFPELRTHLLNRTAVGVTRERCVMFGAACLPTLAEVLARASERAVLANVIEVVRMMGKTALPLKAQILGLMKHRDPNVRTKACQVVQELGVENRDRAEVAEAVFESVGGEYPRLTSQAIQTLGPDGLRETILPRLDRDWLSPDPKVRLGVVAALCESELPEALDRLLGATRDPVAEIRLHAAYNLSLYTSVIEVRDRLRELMSDPDVGVRRRATSSISDLWLSTPNFPSGELRRGLDDPDPQIVSSCARAFWGRSSNDPGSRRAGIAACLPRLDPGSWREVFSEMLMYREEGIDLQGLLIDRLRAQGSNTEFDWLLWDIGRHFSPQEARPEVIDAVAGAASQNSLRQIPHETLVWLAATRPLRASVRDLVWGILAGIVGVDWGLEDALFPLGEHFGRMVADMEPEFVAHGNADMARAIASVGPVGVDFFLRIRETHRDNRLVMASVAEGLCEAESRPEEVLAALVELAPMFADFPDLQARISQRVSPGPPETPGTADDWMENFANGTGLPIEEAGIALNREEFQEWLRVVHGRYDPPHRPAMHTSILRVIDELTEWQSERDPDLYLPHLRAILALTLAALREENPRSAEQNLRAGEIVVLLSRVAERFASTAFDLAAGLATLLGHPAFPPTMGVDRDIIPALGELGDPSVVPRLLPYLRDISASLAGRAAVALGRLRSPDAVGGLLEALTDNRHRIRRDAAKALDWIGVASETVLEALTVAKADPESSVRKRAERAFNSLSRKAADPPTEEPEG